MFEMLIFRSIFNLFERMKKNEQKGVDARANVWMTLGDRVRERKVHGSITAIHAAHILALGASTPAPWSGTMLASTKVGKARQKEDDGTRKRARREKRIKEKPTRAPHPRLSTHPPPARPPCPRSPALSPRACPILTCPYSPRIVSSPVLSSPILSSPESSERKEEDGRAKKAGVRIFGLVDPISLDHPSQSVLARAPPSLLVHPSLSLLLRLSPQRERQESTGKESTDPSVLARPSSNACSFDNPPSSSPVLANAHPSYPSILLPILAQTRPSTLISPPPTIVRIVVRRRARLDRARLVRARLPSPPHLSNLIHLLSLIHTRLSSSPVRVACSRLPSSDHARLPAQTHPRRYSSGHRLSFVVASRYPSSAGHSLRVVTDQPTSLVGGEGQSEDAWRKQPSASLVGGKGGIAQGYKKPATSLNGGE
ncbi:hypothetical protein BDN70DRAFT_902212 [Pholiota conissans]|uniref:Uncharacterized protein n=1 Tax=Pholiota conissans TaxID=109636 RepID=A0A9P5YK91_9AGAR|nr:hypothetical protein BDN70DRAFT_902212 [Pholiota conissans]